MADLAKLVVALEANQSKLIRGLDDTNKRIRAFQQRTDSSLKKVDKAFASASRGVNLLKGALVALGAKRVIGAIIEISDSYRQAEGILKIVTSSTQELTKVQDELFQVAQRSRTSYEGTVDLYARIARNADELGASQSELVEVTEAVGKASLIASKGVQESAAGILQLSQAFSSGRLQGDELRSVLENTPRIAKAIADGLGTTIGGLRELSKQGELTATKVFDALLAQKQAIEEEFALLPVTVKQSLLVLSNEIRKSVASADISPLIEAIEHLTELVKRPEIVDGIVAFSKALIDSVTAIAGFIAAYGRLLDKFANTEANIQSRIERLNSIIAQQGGEGSISARPLINERDQLVRDLNVGIELTPGAQETLDHLNAVNEAVEGLARGFFDVEKSSQQVTLKVATDAIKKAETETRNAINSLQSLEQSLRQEFETAGLEGAALLEYRLSVGDLSDELKKAGSAGREAAEGALAYQRAIDDAAEAQKYFDELLEKDAQQLAEINNLREKHNDLISGADANTRQYLDTLEDLHRLQELGAISSTELTNATARATEAFSKSTDKTGEDLERVTTFSDEAARGIQQAFADFFFDPFDEGLKGLLDNLQRTLDRAAAEILASQLSGFLFGNQAGSSSSGFGGGFFGSLLGLFGGGSSGTPGASSFVGPLQGVSTFADGGRYSANEPRIVGEFGPELDIPDHSGRIIPNNQLGGGMNVTINQSVTVADGGTLSPRSRHQIANETAIGVQRALARHNGR